MLKCKIAAAAAMAAVLTVVAHPATVQADEKAVLSGTVRSAGGEPVAGAEVSLPEIRRTTVTDDQGNFSFDNLPFGEFLISVSSLRSGGAVQRVSVTPTPSDTVTLTLDKLVHSQGITVTAAGVARGLGEVVQPVDVLGGDDLVLRRQSTLGETLAQQPGVTASTYGQGSSRPVIRGLGADRIRILENGLDTGDVSSIGPDHAVAMDPLAAEQIEVVRGPAAVLWGANAIGGVVNVLDGRVPDKPATAPVAAAVELEYGSNANKKSGAAKLDGGVGHFAWHLDLYSRDQDDYSSPAERSGHDGEPETGKVENSWADAQGATIGGSYVADGAFIGIAVGGYDTAYGIPGHSHDHRDGGPAPPKQDDEEAPGVYSDLEQRRFDLHGQLDDPFPGFSAVKLSAGWRDYNHQEMEGDVIGTQFDNRWIEGRLDLTNTSLLGFTGTLGLQYVNREFAATGEEAFVEPTDTTKMGAYVFQQTAVDPVGLQFGLRYDNQDTRSSAAELADRDFRTWSASAGVVWDFLEHWGLTASLNRPERAPTPEELYADGPHAATNAYEIGNPDLDAEVGRGFEASLRVEYPRFEATLSAFTTRYSDFIYLAETGDEIDGFEVYRFSQNDAEFTGFELHGHAEILHTGANHLHLGFSYDQVDAEFLDTGEPLPRIPPRRGRLALIFQGERVEARVEGWWVDDQTRVWEHEAPTPGYTTLNASVSYRLFAARMVHEFILRGRNLTDAAAYNHVSFLKFDAPLPGRDISLIYRLLL
jgi:iron complex outermembrane receptor protein